MRNSTHNRTALAPLIALLTLMLALLGFTACEDETYNDEFENESSVEELEEENEMMGDDEWGIGPDETAYEEEGQIIEQDDQLYEDEGELMGDEIVD